MRERKKTFWFGYFAALIMWSICAYSLLFTMIAEGKLFAFSERNAAYVSDFVNVHNAGRLAAQSFAGPVKIYDPAVQSASVKEFVPNLISESPFFLQYPPWFFTLMLPLSPLTLLQSWFAYCLFCAVLMMGALIPFTDKLGSKFARWFAIVAVFASYPTWVSFRMGSTALFLLPSVVAFWHLLRLHKPVASALAASACLIKVQYLPIIGLVGLLRGRLPFVLAMAASLIAMVVASVLNLGMDNLLAWPAALRYETAGTSTAVGVAAHNMQNLRGQLVLLLGQPTWLPGVILGCFALAVAGVGALWLRARDERFLPYAAISTLLLLVASPHTHTQDYVVAVVPCVYLYLWLLQTPEKMRSRSQRILWRLILVFPGLSWALYLIDPVFKIVRVQPFFWWAAVVCLFTALILLRKPPLPGDGGVGG